jgi:hypothetical protein
LRYKKSPEELAKLLAEVPFQAAPLLRVKSERAVGKVR